MKINFNKEIESATPECVDHLCQMFPGERRCECGQLLARLHTKGVELKCKRCRRMHLVPWEHFDNDIDR